jgi:hypothetical protein
MPEGRPVGLVVILIINRKVNAIEKGSHILVMHLKNQMVRRFASAGAAAHGHSRR